MLKRLVAITLICFTAQHAAAKELPDFTELVEKQSPAVVNINITQTVHGTQGMLAMPNAPKGDPLFDFFRHFPPAQQPHDREIQSLGSGFIISSDGYILTNAHVVAGADGISVRLTDKREFKAKVIGSDKRTDVALIKIEATGLPKISQGDPNLLKVGEWVLAIGSPFGLDSSVTAGIVSAKGRSLPQENFVPFIQTDAAINPGNSGGPLFNMRGEVIGINSQIYSRSGGSMGLSFAIPIDVAMEVVNQLRTFGKMTRGRIGVSIQEVTRDLAESFGLSKVGGALISGVEKGGAADKAGIQASDVILKFDGKPVVSSSDLPRLVGNTHPGSKAPVQLWRKGESKELTVTVAEMQDDSQAVAQGNGAAPSMGQNVARLGLALSELSAEQRNELQVNGGLLVVEVKGATARDLHHGDVILAVGNIEVSTLEQFNEVLKQIPKGRNIALLIRREDSSFYIALKLNDKPSKDKE